MINNPTLAAYLPTATNLMMFDLYTIVTKNGVILRYTSADVDQVINGYTFYSSISIKRGAIRHVAGIEVNDLTVTFYPGENDMINGLSFSKAVTLGHLDGAEFKLERAFFDHITGDFLSTIIRFIGNIGQIDEFSRTEIPVTVNSIINLLNIKMPKLVYQSGCRRTLYLEGCNVNPNSFVQSSSVTSSSTTTHINCGLVQAVNYFALGKITFTSGVNSGETRTVKSSDTGEVVLCRPLHFVPEIGDTFSVYPGCDKTMSTCQSKFNNIEKFSGEPFIPPAETAY